MSITKVKEVVLPALEKFWAKIEVKINELNEKLENFEQTKSDIVGSALGTALGMSTEDKWEDVVNDIKGVAVANDYVATTYDLDTTNNRLRFYTPKDAFYKTSNFLYQSYANIANLIGLTAAKIVSGNTILGIDGTDKGYDAGYTEGAASLTMQTMSIEQNLAPPYTYTYQIPLDGTYVFIFAGPVQFADTSGNYETTISYGSAELEYQSQYGYALNGLYGGVCVITKPKVCKAGTNILLRHTGLATSGKPTGNARFLMVRMV